MAIIPLFPGLIIRFVSYLSRSTMRKYYTKQKLSSLVEIKVSSDHSGITVNCSELPDASALIVITNLSPFHVIVHEIEAELYLSSRVARSVRICNKDVGPSCEERLLVQTDLTVKQVDYIKRNKSADNPRLKVKMLLSCSLSLFEISDRVISAENIKFIKCDRYPWKLISKPK